MRRHSLVQLPLQLLHVHQALLVLLLLLMLLLLLVLLLLVLLLHLLLCHPLEAVSVVACEGQQR